MVQTTLHSSVKQAIDDEIVKFIDAKNILELFPSKDKTPITLETIISFYLRDVAEASLTTRGWSPNRTRLEISQMSQQLFSAGLELEYKWMDWQMVEQLGVDEAGLQKIGEKPGKQMSHYFFTGQALFNDGSRGPRPRATNFNFVVEPGTGNGTLSRPLPQDVGSAGTWNTVTNMILDCDNAIGGLADKDFEKQNLLFFYPKVVEKTMIHKIDTGGSGLLSPRQHLIDSGIPADRQIMIDDIYMPTDPLGTPTAPIVTDWDAIFIDKSMTKIFYTERAFANSFIPNPGSVKPDMTIETGLTAMPLFIPVEKKSEGKFYKGVYIINGITNA